MSNAPDFLDKLRQDLPEQFKGKPNIEVLQRALADQLNDVYEFYAQLNTLRWLKDAVGVQLDGIGDIVVMSRAEAYVLSELAGVNVPMDDDNYRLYLTFKIHLNTNNGTHTDMHNALKIFWDKTPILYSENIDYPATIFFTIPTPVSDIEMGVFNVARLIKAAGVALHFLFPEELFTATHYHGGAVMEHITEYFEETNEMLTDTTDYHGGAVYEFVKEVFIDNG